MRDILADVEVHLNNNDNMKSHALVSALANEIVKLRAELETAKKYPTIHRAIVWDLGIKDKTVQYVLEADPLNGGTT